LSVLVALAGIGGETAAATAAFLAEFAADHSPLDLACIVAFGASPIVIEYLMVLTGLHGENHADEQYEQECLRFHY
jgi:hypothetical protein